MAEFVNTTTRIEVDKWYSIHDVPKMEYKGHQYVPISAKLTFVDGSDCSNLVLNVKKVKANGDYAKDTTRMPEVYLWNRSNWPDWLHMLLRQAHDELRLTQVHA